MLLQKKKKLHEKKKKKKKKKKNKKKKKKKKNFNKKKKKKLHVLISFCFSGIIIYFCFFSCKSGLQQYFWQIVKLIFLFVLDLL
jgi:uncharacterized ion transporter superfamily protein YfcC